jgi:autotransporter-associated beta strand protein
MTGAGAATQFIEVPGVTNADALTSLTKTGTGTWTLSGENTYSGKTTVSGGTLTLGNALALQNSALDTTASVTGTATAGLKTTVTTLTLGGLNGNKNLANLFTTDSGGYTTVTALTLNPGNGVTNTYSGIIADGAAGMTLTKSGVGTQVLTGANSYTGVTTVSAGTLATSGATATFGNGDILIGNGATLSLGNGNSIADTANVSFDVGATLLLGTGITETVNTLSSFSGTFIGAGTYDATALQSFFGSGSFAGLGQLTVLTTSAVPEPSTYAVLAGLGILGFAVYRRRSAA